MANAGPAQSTFQPPPLNDQVLGTPLSALVKTPAEITEGRASFSWSGWFTQLYWRFFYLRLSVRKVSGSTALTRQDSTVIAFVQSQALITLFDAAQIQGQIFTIKNNKWSSDIVILDSLLGQTIDNQNANTVILHPGDTVTIQSDGENYIIVSLYTTFVVTVP